MQHDVSSVIEYKLHGWYKNNEDDAGYAETFWVPIHRLRHLGTGNVTEAIVTFLKHSRDACTETIEGWFENEEGEEGEEASHGSEED